MCGVVGTLTILLMLSTSTVYLSVACRVQCVGGTSPYSSLFPVGQTRSLYGLPRGRCWSCGAAGNHHLLASYLLREILC